MSTNVAKVVARPVRHESYSGVRITRQVVAILSDGTEVPCEHGNGHRTDKALHACAARHVARANKGRAA